MQLQMLFSDYETKQFKVRELSAIIREKIETHPKYREVKSNLDTWRAEMNQIKQSVYDELESEVSTLDSLKLDVNGHKMMLCDLAIHQLSNGEPIEIEKDGIKYDPIFSVKFKKAEKSND